MRLATGYGGEKKPDPSTPARLHFSARPARRIGARLSTQGLDPAAIGCPAPSRLAFVTMFRPLSPIAALAAFVVTTSLPVQSALADEDGNVGRVVSLTINTQGSDKYASFHGSLGVRTSDGRRDVYFWGGSTCPAQKLDDSEVALLASAMQSSKTKLRPVYRTGEGARGARCLVAFELRT